MRQVLSILQLTSPLLDAADLYQLASRQLLEIVRQPAFRWKELVREAVLEKGAKEDDIPDWFLHEEQKSRKVAQRKKTDRRRDPATVALGGVRRFRNAIVSVKSKEREAVIGRLATDIAVDKNSKETLEFLQRLVQQLEMRMQD